MNRNSNTYTIIYAVVMVVVVATVLSIAATSLQPLQERNVLTEKMGAILNSIGEAKDVSDAPNKDEYIKDEFNKYIVKTMFVDASGITTEAPAADVLNSLGSLPKVFEDKTAMPVFEAKLSDGKILYIVPITGKGLWGPVWGYIALNADCNVIYGAQFDHKSETPGLGAEIALPNFSNQFIGKQLFKDQVFQSINLTKGVGSSGGNPYAVDAISGGTLTSNGVKAMLSDCLGDYVPFFEHIQKSQMSTVKTDVVVADSVDTSII